jgi:2-hydroxy-6-oxonona-2,4-dienedioate hydrolase
MDINDGKFIDLVVGVAQVSTYYYEAGNPGRETSIFVHTGGAGVSAYMCWNQTLDAFAAADYHVYAPDSPGFGRSAPGNGVDVLLAFMDAHGVQEAHLIGNSGGGMTCTNFAAKHPARVKSLTLSGGEPRVETEGTRDIMPTLGVTPRMEFARAMLAKPELLLADMRRATADFFYNRDHPEVDVVAGLRLDTLSDPALLERVRTDAQAQVGKGRSNTDSAVFAAIKAPTFLLHGRDEPGFYSDVDAPVLLDAAMKVMYGIADCRCTVLPYCGHWPQLENADTYNALVLRFLREVGVNGA